MMIYFGVDINPNAYQRWVLSCVWANVTIASKRPIITNFSAVRVTTETWIATFFIRLLGLVLFSDEIFFKDGSLVFCRSNNKETLLKVLAAELGGPEKVEVVRVIIDKKTSQPSDTAHIYLTEVESVKVSIFPTSTLHFTHSSWSFLCVYWNGSQNFT